MNLKKIISFLFLSFVIIFTLTSCKKDLPENYPNWQEETYEQKVEVPKNIQLANPGYLTIATSPDYTPYEYKDNNVSGMLKYIGSDMYLANYLAQTMGLELKIVESNFDGLTIQLDQDKADIVLAGMTYKKERAENYTFSDIYYNSSEGGGQIILVLKSNYDKYNSFEALNNSDVKIGCQNASVQQELVEDQLPNATPTTIGQIADGINLLKHGNIDAIALSNSNAETLVASNSDLIVLDGFKFDSTLYEGTRGLLKKDSPLTEYINEALSYLEDGSYQKWVDLAKAYVPELSIGDTGNTNFFVRFWNVLSTYILEFLRGTGITLALSALTVIFGTIIALFLHLIRSSRFLLLRSIGNIYVQFVRGIPLLLLLWLLYMIAPSSWPSYVSVGVALFLNSGAYVAEIIRGGILAVDKGQYEAARTLGLSKMQTFKKIILPQATKKILPALGNEFVALIKETSLASVFFIGDLMTVKNNITALTYLSIEPFIIVGIIYFVLTYGITRLIRHFELKMEA